MNKFFTRKLLTMVPAILLSVSSIYPAHAADRRYPAKALQAELLQSRLSTSELENLLSAGFSEEEVDGIAGSGTKARFAKWYTENFEGPVPPITKDNYGYWALRIAGVEPGEYLVDFVAACENDLPDQEPDEIWTGQWNQYMPKDIYDSGLLGTPATIFVYGSDDSSAEIIYNVDRFCKRASLLSPGGETGLLRHKDYVSYNWTYPWGDSEEGLFVSGLPLKKDSIVAIAKAMATE